MVPYQNSYVFNLYTIVDTPCKINRATAGWSIHVYLKICSRRFQTAGAVPCCLTQAFREAPLSPSSPAQTRGAGGSDL